MARPAGDSMLKKIMAQLEVELKKIKTANDYVSNIVDDGVFRQVNAWKHFSVFPCVVITYAGGENDAMMNRSQKKTKTINLIFKLRDDGSSPLSDQIAELEYDLEYLLMQNPTLTTASGEKLVTYIRMMSDVSDQGAYDPYASWTVILEVRYYAKYL